MGIYLFIKKREVMKFSREQREVYEKFLRESKERGNYLILLKSKK